MEQKVRRLVENKEPIKDGAPEIFTQRSEGVISAYNIRTDRWEIATEAMDKVSKSLLAKRDEKAEGVIQLNPKKESKTDNTGSKTDNKNDGGTEPIDGKVTK